MPGNEEQFYKLLISEDEASFKVIYNYFYPRLYYFITEYFPNRDFTEDIIQDTFLTLLRKKKLLREDTNLNAWLYTVAKNNCLKKLRDEKYRSSILKVADLTDVELELNIGALTKLDTSVLTFNEIENIIERTLNELPPQCRLVFEKSRFNNKKNIEIAEELGISVKTVEGHITRAIKSLKITLKDYLPLISFLFIV